MEFGYGSRSRIGTFDWTRRSRGLLSPRDRVEVARQALVYGVATLPAELRRLFGIKRSRLANLDPSLLEPPDSSAAKEAEQLLADMAPPTLVNHSYRTYAWGAALALHDGLTFDREVVYVASLLHDVYFRTPDAKADLHCFTLPAAELAIEVAERAGWTEARSLGVADAITLHLNLIAPKDSPEARAVFFGARLDTVGYRYGDLDPDALKQALHRFPRERLKARSAPMFDAQATRNKGSRVHFYTRYLACNWFVRRTQFSE
ncbi:MAG: HD domain-containing protein [Actinomycetota bacterium]